LARQDSWKAFVIGKEIAAFYDVQSFNNSGKLCSAKEHTIPKTNDDVVGVGTKTDFQHIY
jgi:hypothetical protein